MINSVLPIAPVNLREMHTFDEAVGLTGNGILHRYILFVTGLAMMGLGIEGNSMAYVLPAAKCELHMTTAEQGLTYVVAHIGFVCASHFWGFLADTWGRKKVLQTALFMCFIISIISSYSSSSLMLMLTRFAVGFGVAGIKGSAFTYVGEFHNNANRAEKLSFLSGYVSFSSFVHPLLGLLILTQSFEIHIFGFSYTPWRVFIFVGSLISGTSAVCLFLLPESPKFMLAVGKKKDAIQILRKMYASSTGEAMENYPIKEIVSLDGHGKSLSDAQGVNEMLHLVWDQTKGLFVEPYLKMLIILCLVLGTLFFVSDASLLWYPQILAEYSDNMDLTLTTCDAIAIGRKHVSLLGNGTTSVICDGVISATTFYVSLIQGVTLSLLTLFVALAIKRFGSNILITGWLAINTIAAGGLIWSNYFYLNTVFMILVISTIACSTILSGVIGDLFPTHLRAMAINLIVMCSRLGAIIGTNVTAAMIYNFCQTLYGINLALSIGTTITVYFVLRRCNNLSNGLAL